MDGVNQGAAIVMTSVGYAKELGIDPAKWIFLHGCAEASEKINVVNRVNYHSSPAIGINVRHALSMADLTLKDIDYFDFYSCFPSAVEIACEELNLSYEDSRGYTVTGGLPFFGGPGNNYSMHAIATMLPKLRANPSHFGLVTANGGYLSKHATGIYSAAPVMGEWERENPINYQREIDSMESPAFTESPSGLATVETYTICHTRGIPDRGIVIGRLADSGQRFLANTPVDSELFDSMIKEEQIGRAGTVENEGELNIFFPH
jgi:acetyl-CoA C-acetyltransferase